MPTELTRFVTPGFSYLGSPTFMGPVTMQMFQQQLNGDPTDTSEDCAEGSTQAGRNCN